MTSTRRDSQLAFLLGFGMSFLPSFGPFAGILFVLTNRLRLRRGDVAWGLAALASAVAVGMHEGLLGVGFGALQVLGPWAVFRAFSELRRQPLAELRRPRVLHGLFAGFLVLVAMGLGHVSLNLAYPTITQAIAWGGNPTLFAHMVLVVGCLIALLANGGWLRTGSLALTTVAVLAAGSREAAFGLLLVLGYLVVHALVSRRLREGIGPLVLVALLIAALGFGPQLGVGRTGYRIASAASDPGVNLVRGSELPWGDWWDSRNVTVVAGSVRLQTGTLTDYRVTKRGSATWYRLQQVVPLDAGTTYTVSAWVLDQGTQHAGIQGWGQAGGASPFTLTAALVDHRLQVGVTGAGALDASGIAASDGSWKRIYATFTYRGPQAPLNWSVGLAPDARQMADTSATFAGFQLERGPLTAYRPGAASRGLDFTAGRADIWRVAWQGVKQRPWLGWGPSAFPAFYRGSTLAAAAADGEVPAHAHNLFLEVLFERGVVGFAGLLLLLGAFVWPSVRRRDLGLLAVLSAVLLANVFDYTFFFGGVIYPLAAVVGWRARERTEARPAADSLSRQFLVRLALAAVDLGLAWTAFTFAAWLLPALGAQLSYPPSGPALGRYALLLWPALAWREGLYPGYGLTEPDELKRQILAAVYAGALFLIGALFFGNDLGVDPGVIIATTVFSAVLTPVGRAGAKRVLRAIGLWGRPVIILGSGRAAERIAETLSHRSLDGLRPVGIFGNRRGCDGDRAEAPGAVPHIGPIAAANTFARREGIHHAIVAMEPGAGPPGLPRLDPEVDAFTIVQYVPDLPGLPVLGVRASTLDNLLALEVRNELASPFNRALKRVLDVVAVIIGGVLVSPVLLAIALAIALDSRGPLFFAHERIGRGGRTLRVWKFRTMAKDAEASLERHLAADPALRAEWEATHKLKHDPRVTRVGRFLRRFSLDELPQLWNVLKGEMSLVGPRPIVTAEVPRYAETFDLYSMVRPGMTGYWQISGRSDTDYGQRVELDSFYVRNWSVWLDIVVLLKTVSVVLKRDGAY